MSSRFEATAATSRASSTRRDPRRTSRPCASKNQVSLSVFELWREGREGEGVRTNLNGLSDVDDRVDAHLRVLVEPIEVAENETLVELPETSEDDGVTWVLLVEHVEESNDRLGVRGRPWFLKKDARSSCQCSKLRFERKITRSGKQGKERERAHRSLNHSQEDNLRSRLHSLVDDILALLPNSSVLARRRLPAHLEDILAVPGTVDERLRSVCDVLSGDDPLRRGKSRKVEGVGGKGEETIDEDELRERIGPGVGEETCDRRVGSLRRVEEEGEEEREAERGEKEEWVAGGVEGLDDVRPADASLVLKE